MTLNRSIRRTLMAPIGVLWLSASLHAEEAIRLGSAEAPSKSAESIRLVTYNVLNLFDEHDDPSLTERFDDFYDSREGLRAKPESEKKAVAETIRRLDADVIGLQEIESYDALIEFREAYLSDLGYDYVVSVDVGQERGIEQAVMSRFPILEARVWPHMALGGVHPDKYGNQENWYAGEPIMYRRSPLMARVEVPAGARGNEKPYELTMFVVHHKSGYYNGYWREKEAVKLAEMLNQFMSQHPDWNIAVLGDFNAEPDDYSVKIYEQDAGLRSVFGERTGHGPAMLTHQSDRCIDYIYVNKALAKELVPDSAFVLGTPVIPEGADYRTAPKPDGFAADHMPVAVDIVPVEK